MRIALGQINPTVGDFEYNLNLLVHNARRAAERGADLVVFPELALCGYPPRDLVEKESFLCANERYLNLLAAQTAELPLAVICGYVSRSRRATGKPAQNSAALLKDGQLIFRQDKMLLPTYDVFDEARYFAPAERQYPLQFHGLSIALTICEDAWNDRRYWEHRLYDRDPVEEMAHEGAQLLITINASPYCMGKRQVRQDIFAAIAAHHQVPVIYVNQVGGNDHLIFDGSSFAISPDGSLLATGASFREDLVLVDLEASEGDRNASVGEELEAVYEALVLGTRDYMRKCGFKRALLGLSGGIDSSLTAVLAVDAIGADNVTGVSMPGPYSSEGSFRDARLLAENLGIRFEVVSITPAYQQVLHDLKPLFDNLPPDVTEENIQSRLRGLTLMALSNKWGALVLTTGNKSELAVGYCTLYGDMCGGLAVISDVPKTMVYRLARLANRRHSDAIPAAVFEKPPSAELRPNQKDADSLPDYEILDFILRGYVEELKTPERIACEGNVPLELVKDIIRKVDRAEYKRQQAAPGLKVTTKAFGMGRRFPIAQRFME
jgi:NAD+ synthase/NAD+ synthase (glutamine-hydrolysing)